MNPKIFIIEDDANILYGLQAKFSVNGFAVEVSNGSLPAQELVNEIIKYKSDYVVLDLLLPKVDGFEVAKLLKQNKETANVPIFIFTNLSDSDSKSRGLDLGINYYFIKDELSLDDFVDKVKRIIDNRLK